MKTKYHPLTTIIPLSIVCALLLGYQYLGANWSEPTQAPTGGNVPAPINVGSVDQVKNGGLSIDALAVFGDTLVQDGDLIFTFKNTTDGNALTDWRMRANDGSGNLNTYINSQGGRAATMTTAGYALRQLYNPGSGRYRMQSSGTSTLAAGASIDWYDTFSVWPDGRIGVRELCDESGNNCTAPADLSTPGGGVVATYRSVMSVPPAPAGVREWPDYIVCRESGDTRNFTLHLSEIRDDGKFYYDVPYADAVIRKIFSPDGSHWSATTAVIQDDCGSSGTSLSAICAAGRCGYF